MAVTIKTSYLARLACPPGYQSQIYDGELYFVIAASKPSLYERLHITPVGRSGGDFVIGASLSIVRDVRLQTRGLTTGGSLAPLCTDPDNGRIAFGSKADLLEWIGRFIENAPGIVRVLSDRKGDDLLLQTKAVRDDAQRVFDATRRIAPDGGSAKMALAEKLGREGIRMAHLLLRPPLLAGPTALSDVYQAVALALIAFADPEALALATGNTRAINELQTMMQVPDSLIQRARIMGDLLLASELDLSGEVEFDDKSGR